MARIANVAVKGLQGMVGGTLVYRKVNGRTVVSAAPDDAPRAVSESQMAHREKFKQASFYASRAMMKPETKALYVEAAKAEGMPNPRAVALADYFRAPRVAFIETREYKGQPGEEIAVSVANVCRPNKVTVGIYAPDSSELESGEAVYSDAGHCWVYNATVVNSELQGTRIAVQVTDLPGNEGEGEVTL